MIPLRYNLRSLMVRKTTTFATAFGIGLVVFVLASALMLSSGIAKTFKASGRPDYAIVLRVGSDTELASTIETEEAGKVLAMPGLARGADDTPLATGELVVVLALSRKDNPNEVSNVQVRGIPDATRLVRPEARLVAGRFPNPGTDEVIIGRSIVGRFRDMEIGEKFELKRNRPVTVVGVFETAGSSFESEIWSGLDTLRTCFGSEGLVSSVTARLDSQASFDRFKAAIESDKRLGLEALRESAYYEKQSNNTSAIVLAIGAIVSFFFSIGAGVGAIITMLAAISQRRREIGTLRALGFSRLSILSSFLLESLILALIGGGFGLLGALAMGFAKISMMNFATWQEITFRFEPNASFFAAALAAGCGMGLAGGLIPALQAARVPAIEALRA